MTKRIMRLVSALLCCSMLFGGLTALADDDYRKPTWIQADGSKSVTMYKGGTAELEVEHDGGEQYLSWSVTSGKTVVQITSADKTDDEIRIKALKAGTAKVTCKIKGTTKKVTYTITVKNASATKRITRVGAATVTLRVGQDRDLEVKRGSGVTKRDVKWTITGTKGIVKFEPGESRWDDEIEIIGVKTGTTVVTCTNHLNNQKIRYTVKVVAR